VLLILDRNVDLVSMVSHGWTYQVLVSDCLEIRLNRIVITQPQKKSYDLDSKDFFWQRNAANPFPQVAEEIDAELNKYKQDAADITRSTGVSDVNDIAQLSVSFFPIVAALKSNTLPQGSLNKRCPSEDGHHAAPRADSAQSHP
jgi:sec1 family domain-containing protein 1